MAVATTAKAVAELAGAGLDARTIARLRIDLADGPLAAGHRGGVGRDLPDAHRRRSKQSWPRWMPARVAACGCWATPANPSRSGRAGSPTTWTGSPPTG